MQYQMVCLSNIHTGETIETEQFILRNTLVYKHTWAYITTIHERKENVINLK